MKTCGLILRTSSLFLFYFISFLSSAQNKESESNYFNKDYFYNNSIKVGIDFDKNLEFTSFSKQEGYEKLLKGFPNLSKKNLFLVAKSKEKQFEIYFFFESELTSKVNSARIVINDTVQNYSIFEKQNGSKKVIGLIKSISKIESYLPRTLGDNLLTKISIDSLDSKKISFFSVFFNYFPNSHPNNLHAREKIMNVPIKEEVNTNMKFQFLATINSFMSNNKSYDSLINRYEKSTKEEYNSIVDDLAKAEGVYKNESVFSKIAQIAKDNSVIILNEDHYYPKHRFFTMELLEILKLNGYLDLSLEAFSPSDKSDFIPNNDNGTYTGEPYYAHFLRKAKAMGFKIHGHENFDKSIDRELGQAKNILKILEINPKAKIFVYVGHSHIEKEYLNKKWMAQYLKELSGINPITINQVAICADNKEELMLIPREYLNDSTKVKSSADFFLVNNMKPSLKRIYPNAVFKEAKIRHKSLVAYKNEEVLVEVMDFKEYDLIKKLAIPIESFLTMSKDKEIKFELPVGKYHVFVKTADDEVIYDDDLIVN
jgi:hypothetical protein